MNIRAVLQENAAMVETALQEYTKQTDPDFAAELEAERYSLLAGGKRIRPTLVLEFCRMFAGSVTKALPFAAAVEMVHTYSLIHDDLPCMDDDDMRRGRPTCHKQFGEAIALLAGDGLLTRAFGVLSGNTAVAPGQALAAVRVLSHAAGSFGMIGGQVMDLAGEGAHLDEKTLSKLHAHKTGALIRASAVLGCLAAGLCEDDARVAAAARFADGIGLAFQIVDDVLDATASVEELGKSVGSDEKREKTTFLTYYSPKEALDYARRVTDAAKQEIASFANAECLLALADYLIDRKN